MNRAVLVCAALVVFAGATYFGQGQQPTPRQPSSPVVLKPTRAEKARKRDVSRPLREKLPSVPLPLEALHQAREHERPVPRTPETRPDGLRDPVVQSLAPVPAMPQPLRTFDGLDNISRVLPPDTNGDVSPSHYVQWVNSAYAIFNRSGALTYGPFAGNTLWEGFGSPCETTNDGDPIVLYDRLADRWVLSQFGNAFSTGPYYQCVAVSTTSDPTGSYYRYAFKISDTKLNDYPHLGVWPDAYYMSVNQFTNGSWAGAGVIAFERQKMLAGDPGARMVYFDLYSTDPNVGGFLPSNLVGAALPPSGEPNRFVEFDAVDWGYPRDELEVWNFSVNWANPRASTFSGPTLVPTAPFRVLDYYNNRIPQPNTMVGLDNLGDRMMHSLTYRRMAGYSAIVGNHSVRVGDSPWRSGVRWYELRIPDSTRTPVIHQQGTYAPSGLNRWMGSISMDKAGNIALGYSASSARDYPSIRYTGRLASDPLGRMPQGETEMYTGSGSQTHPSGRWGDYSMMAIDPTDNCTFWYTQEYLQATGEAPWRTRVGSFRFPSCGAASAKKADLVVASLAVTPVVVSAPGPLTVTDTTKNRGMGPAPASTTSFYLSSQFRLTADAVLLGSRQVPALAAGAQDTATTTVTIPAGTAIGSDYLIARADATRTVPESREGNNLKRKLVTVR